MKPETLLNKSQDAQRPALRLCHSDIRAVEAGGNVALEGMELKNIPTGSIVRSPYQPRLAFDKGKLAELADSIKVMGVIKPIVVRLTTLGFELVGGERRWRAASSVGLSFIPAIIIQDLSDSAAMLLAISDNTGEPLTDYESAVAYARILNSGEEKSQSTLAASLGINKSTVSRCLRLVELPESIQAILRVQPELITSNYAKQFVDYAKQNPHLVERVINSAMVSKKQGQVAVLRIIAQRISACTQVIPQAVRKSISGLGDMHVKGRKLQFSCEEGVDPALLMEQFEAFLSQLDPTQLRGKPSDQ